MCGVGLRDWFAQGLHIAPRILISNSSSGEGRGVASGGAWSQALCAALPRPCCPWERAPSRPGRRAELHWGMPALVLLPPGTQQSGAGTSPDQVSFKLFLGLVVCELGRATFPAYPAAAGLDVKWLLRSCFSCGPRAPGAGAFGRHRLSRGSQYSCVSWQH